MDYKNQSNQTLNETSRVKTIHIDASYIGLPLDDKLSDGPIENRRCTDFL